MIQIVGNSLNQWDVGRLVQVTGEASHVHFANQGDSVAVIIDIVDGKAKIPDYLLQTGRTLFAYSVLNGVTLERVSFAVRKRERPENYVYEDDRRNYIYELITDAENAVVDANLAAKNANEAADKAIQAAKSWVMVGEVNGENIVLDDAIEQSFAGFRIFGKTTQDGVPSPEVPVALVSVGGSGSITVDVTGDNEAQSMTVATPNGLSGVPVSSGGNYTDVNGQQWICDEIDLARGVYVQRVQYYMFTGTEYVYAPYWNSTGFSCAMASHGLPLPYTGETGRPVMCNHLHNDGIELDSLAVGGMLYFRNVGSFADDQEAKAWLKNRFDSGYPLEVIYPLETPIETTLSAEEIAAYAALYTYRDHTTVTNDASAHMELEYVMDAKKYIDSLLSASVVRLSYVTIKASDWLTEAESLHSQVVTINGITPYSKVDLLPSAEQLAIFHNKNVAFVTENEDGVVTVFAIGDKPTNDYTMQVQITEVTV